MNIKFSESLDNSIVSQIIYKYSSLSEMRFLKIPITSVFLDSLTIIPYYLRGIKIIYIKLTLLINK